MLVLLPLCPLNMTETNLRDGYILKAALLTGQTHSYGGVSRNKQKKEL